MEGENGDHEFEDRFLQCFGLVDPAPSRSGPTRTNSEPTAEDKDITLKRQAQSSPWYNTYRTIIYVAMSPGLHIHVHVYT